MSATMPVFSWRGRPVMAVRGSVRRALQFFPDTTPRMRLAGLLVRMCGPLSGLLLRNAPVPTLAGGDPDDFLDELILRLGLPVHTSVIIYPPPARSTTRLYVHLLDENGHPVAFVKTAMSEADAVGIRAEADALRRLQEMSITAFRHPRVLCQHTWKQCEFTAVTPLPRGVRPVPLSWEQVGAPCKRAFASHISARSPDELVPTRWVQKFLNSSGNSAFRRAFDEAFIGQIAVTVTHGDYLLHNMRSCGTDTWIYDWEESTCCGPVLADEIAFKLCLHRFGLGMSRKMTLQRFQDEFLVGQDAARRRDALFAVAFLCGTGAAMAHDAASCWSN